MYGTPTKEFDFWNVHVGETPFDYLLMQHLPIGSEGAEDMAEAALWIYGTAFQELNRQISTECKDRAELLTALWDHFSVITQIKSAIEYEDAIARTQQEYKNAQKAEEDARIDKQVTRNCA